MKEQKEMTSTNRLSPKEASNLPTLQSSKKKNLEDA
jgi:hypothetical protein